MCAHSRATYCRKKILNCLLFIDARQFPSMSALRWNLFDEVEEKFTNEHNYHKTRRGGRDSLLKF